MASHYTFQPFLRVWGHGVSEYRDTVCTSDERNYYSPQRTSVCRWAVSRTWSGRERWSDVRCCVWSWGSGLVISITFSALSAFSLKSVPRGFFQAPRCIDIELQRGVEFTQASERSSVPRYPDCPFLASVIKKHCVLELDIIVSNH